MADDLNDLGIVYKDEATSSSKSSTKKSSDDLSDLGIVFKNEEQKKPEEKSGILNDILEAGGTIGRGLEYGLSDIANVPIEAANYLNKKVAGAFGVKPENVPTPEPINPQDISMPFVSQERQAQLDPLARAGATAAEIAAPIGDIAKLGTTAGKIALNKISDLTGANADEKATNFIKGLIRNQPQIKEAFTESYGKLGDAASQRGYNLDIHKTKKPIDSSAFNSTFNKMDFNERKGILNNLSSDAKDSLTQFTNKPSYQNAHDLQSILGREGIDLIKGRDTARVGKNILNTRNALNKDITNSFVKNGDTDLAQMRQNITKAYAENENRLLLADKLKAGISNLPVGGLTANAKKIINSYGKADFKKLLGRPGANIKNEQTDAAITDMQNALARQANIKNIAKKLRWPVRGALLGLAGSGGYHYGKELF